jgi:O2-independent ubiquinone biosynthesis protein UbiV
MEVSMDFDAFSISVGPVLYYWPRKTLIEFYAQVAESAATSVALGEVVCSRRHEMKLDDWLALAGDLVAAGKEVVLATQSLIESEAELRTMHRIAEQQGFLVEANDAAALHRLAGRAFVIGPHINIYSGAALAELVALGAVRWVPPVELSIDAIGAANAARTVETEVFGFGRLPLAMSARCFTARHYALSRDDCGFRCLEHPDGLPVKTQEGQEFLVLNGLQTQSARVQCLLGWRSALIEAGVRRLRLSPTSQQFGRVIETFHQGMNRGAGPTAGEAELVAAGLPGQLADGYAHRRAGLEWSRA